MMPRDREIQDDFDRLQREAGEPHAFDAASYAGDEDRAAYAAVFAALGDDTGFALPAGFAEAVAASAMPALAPPSVYERWILPILLVICSALVLPTVVPHLARAYRIMVGPSGGASAALAVLALLLVAAMDQLARRRGWVRQG